MELVLLIVLATSIWVFFDAPTVGESRLWALGFLLLWIIAFPWYLAVRSRKRASASGPLPGPGWYADPDEPDGRRWWDGRAWTEHRE